MDDLIARARTAKTPEHKAGLKREFDKVKDERDSYFKIKEELSGDELNQRMAQLGKDASAGVTQSMNRQSDARIAALKNPPKPKSFMQQVGDKQIGMVKGAWKGLTGSVEEAGIGQDLVTPQQRVQQSTPQKQTPVGKAVDTAKQAAKWLAGKGGPGKEGPTYEATATAPRAFGVGNFQRLVKANMSNRPYVDLEFANPGDNLKLDQAGLDLISDYYDGLETDQAKNHFIYRVLPSADEVKTILTKLGWHSAGQQQLPLAEKKKFSSSSDLEAGDVKVARELQKLRAQYPAAKSDVEAVAKAELDGTERSQQQLAAIKGANEKQDALLKQLVSLDQEQGRELDDLDQENNTLEKRLARVQATNDRLQQTVSQIAGTKKTDSKPDQTKADTTNKTNQDDDEEDVEPTIDIIPNAPVDNTPTPKANSKAGPKKVYTKRKEKTPKTDTFGQMAQQIAGFPKDVPDDTKTDTAIKEPKKAGNREPEDDVVQRPGSLKALRPTTGANADEFKLVAEQQNKLSAGDPIIVTAPNEFEGKTGEIYDFSPSGTFVIVDLYNHGKHSMHLSDVEYNQYADEEVDEGWYDPKSFPGAKIGPHIAGPERTPVPQVKDQIIKLLMAAHKDLVDKYGQRDVNIVAQSEAAKAEPTPQGIRKAVNNVINFLTSGLSVNRLRQQTLEDEVDEGYASTIGINPKPLDAVSQWKFNVRQLIADYIDNPQGLYNIAKQKGANSAEAMAYKFIMHPKGKIDLPPDAVTFEGYQDFNKVEPYAVCLAGKPVKKFDYYEEARRFHDNWKQKLYREGNKEKADKITLMPLNLDEAQLDEINRRGFLKGAGLAAATAAGIAGKTAYDKASAPRTVKIPETPAAVYLIWYVSWLAENSHSRNSKKSIPEIDKWFNEISPLTDETDQMIELLSLDPKTSEKSDILYSARSQGMKDADILLKTLRQASAMYLDNKGYDPEYLNNIVKYGKPKYLKLKELLSQPVKEEELDEASSPVQQAAIAIAMKKAGKKPKSVDEDTGSWIVYDPETKQIKKRFKTHTAGKSYAKTHSLGFASSEYYFDNIKQAVNELDINTLKSYADKRGAQVAAMKSDNSNPVAGSKEWIKQAVPAQNVARAGQKIARKERQAGVAETALNPRDPAGDYAAKRKALQDLGMNKAVDQQAVLQRRLDLDREAKAKGVTEVAPPGAKAERMVKHIKKSLSKDGKLSDKDKAIAYATTWKAHNAGKVEEAETDYQKRRQRERDVDAGRPVKPLPKNPQTDYARKRAKDRKEMELGEGLMKDPTNRKEYLDQRDKLFRMMSLESNPANKQIIKQAIKELETRFGSTTNIRENEDNGSDAVERAILNRIMVAHTDLLMKFGPEKVMQAAEEVAYNVGDVDEIGTSDVSAYVNQVKQILGAVA
jgi:hypothetical protein